MSHGYTPATTEPRDVLAAALRAQASGSLPAMAAADLFIETTWMDDLRFVQRFVQVGQSHTDPSVLMAVVDWRAALAAIDSGALYASSSADVLLRACASLRRVGKVDLADLSCLDNTNIRLVARAVLACRELTTLEETPDEMATRAWLSGLH